jgi:hypothetical protein
MIKMVEKNIGLSVVSCHSLKAEKGVQMLKIQNLKILKSFQSNKMNLKKSQTQLKILEILIKRLN